MWNSAEVFHIFKKNLEFKKENNATSKVYEYSKNYYSWALPQKNEQDLKNIANTKKTKNIFDLYSGKAKKKNW